MKFIFFSLVCFFSMTAFTQQCDCRLELDSVRNFIETNYAGKKDKVTAATLNSYNSHNQKANLTASRARSASGCLYVIHDWLSFFRDNHVQVMSNQAAMTEEIEVSPAVLRKGRKAGALAVEGIYYTADSTYTVAVIKQEDGFRQYAGVILESRAPEWKPGNVKFELINTGKDQYDVIWYNRSHFSSFGKIDFRTQNGFQSHGWLKSSIISTPEMGRVKAGIFEEEKDRMVFFKQVDESTGYLRIRSFGGRFASQIDSTVEVNKKIIERCPNLIIDLRDNGGGSDFAYRSLSPLIYTNPIHAIGLDMLATDDNILAWEKILDDKDIPDDTRRQLTAIIDTAKNNTGKMVNIFEDQTDSSGKMLPYPQKVAILVNRYCASTTEQFLLEAVQSKKVELFGENTQGVLDYSNMRAKQFSCIPILLYYATTRSRRIDAGKGIDNVGIAPHFKIDFAKPSWFEELIRKIKN
jgi:hypothetical protein